MRFRRLPCLLACALALSACAPQPAQEQFTLIDEPQASPAASTVTETPEPVTETVVETRSVPASAPAASTTYDGIVPRTSADNPESGFSAEKRDVAGPGRDVVIMAIRSGAHDGFDRVVYEFSGQSVPGFNTRWVDQPIAYGSDAVLPVAGNAFLRLEITGTTDDSGRAYSLEQSAGYVKDIYHTSASVLLGDKTEYFIGLDRKRPYRIFYLNNPARLVVDFES